MIRWFMKDALWYANQTTLTESKKKKNTILLIMLNKVVIQEPNAREFEYVCGDWLF